MTNLLFTKATLKFHTITAVCYALDILFTTEDISAMFDLTEQEATEVVTIGLTRGMVKKNFANKFEFISYEKEKYAELNLDDISKAILVVVEKKKVDWSVLEMDRLTQRNLLSGNQNEQVVEITRKMALLAKLERKYSLAIDLFRVNAEFSRARHLEKNIHTRSIVDLSAMELCQGITSSDVFEMQKEEITRITPDTTSFYDVLLMLYYGMWCFHLGDWWEGYNYRKNALIMASNFDVGEYEREFATLRTLHFSYSGYVGNTISSYEANLAEMEKDKEAPINGYYQITIMFA